MPDISWPNLFPLHMQTNIILTPIQKRNLQRSQDFVTYLNIKVLPEKQFLGFASKDIIIKWDTNEPVIWQILVQLLGPLTYKGQNQA